MKLYFKKVQDWSMSIRVYATRTKAEGEMIDFIECAFRPDMSLVAMKELIDQRLGQMPERLQGSFYVGIRKHGTINRSTEESIPIYCLSVRYRTRWLITISEPINSEFHDAKRKFADVH